MPARLPLAPRHALVPAPHRAPPGRGGSRKSRIKNSIQIGKYLVSPLIKRLADGRFAPSVSIRSGRGSATHDRVMRFTPVFGSNNAAANYATAQGISWIQGRMA